MTSAVAAPVSEPRDRVLRLIALFKFCKAMLLVVVGLGALELLDPNMAARAQHWVAALASSSDRSVVQRVIALVSGLSPGRLEALGVGAFLYAGLFTIEGVGLWRGKSWAEYLTVIATLSLVPLEVFELTRAVTLPRAAALGVNLAVVAYLLGRLRRRARATAKQGRSPGTLGV
ncbi:MAG TPA: DUF2127 domain-containing protein [Gemmatimonadales bacterium]|nr:DUF2127 domain-containing protein [Gemmatimonadales bacterium]